MFDRRLIEYFDWGLLLIVFCLNAIGIVTIYSAVNAGLTTPTNNLYIKQMIWFGAGTGAMIACFIFSYRRLDHMALPAYLFCILLLVAVIFFGKYVGGSRRWLAFGPLSLQPSELVKIGVIIMLAKHYSRRLSKNGLNLKDLIQPAIIIAIPFVLIVKQPDLGTAMVLVLIASGMTLFVKVERRTLISIIIAGAVLIPMVWNFLKGYQQRRILTFLNPDRDPLGAGYHVIQSKIAIGSGMITGKGYLQGTQNTLEFLPEQHTDFIFSVLAEEWGFLGAGSVLVLFLILLLWGLNIAYKCRDPFGTIMAVGVVMLLFWEAFINVGMVMGLMPVVGVPLPFISYGGSSTITVMIGIGLLLNISMRRFLFEK